MSRINLFASVGALTICLLIAHRSQGIVIYSQDFNGGLNGQSISNPPYSFTGNPGGGFLVTNTTPLGGSLAVRARSEADGGGATGVAYVPITGPSGTAGLAYTLTASTNGLGGLNDAWIGLANSAVNGGQSFNNAGAYIGYSGDPARIRFDARGIRSGADADVFVFSAAESAPFFNTNAQVTVSLDFNTNTATGTITNGVNTLTHSFVGGNTFSAIDRFVIQQFQAGINVDNVLIVEAAVPEPSTAVLLGLGGVFSGLMWRRCSSNCICISKKKLQVSPASLP